MIVFKILILSGFLPLALGSSNCCDENREKIFFAQFKQKPDVSGPRNPFALARQQEPSSFDANTHEEVHAIAVVPPNDEAKTDTNQVTPAAQSRPKQENKQNAKKRKGANEKEVKDSAAKKKKLMKPEEDDQNKEEQDNLDALLDNPEAWAKSDDNAEMEKKLYDYECENGLIQCVGPFHPAYSLIFCLIAVIVRYVRGKVDEYGLVKLRERELLKGNAYK